MTDVKRGFKKKTIAKAIRQKVAAWLNTVDDVPLRKEILENYILTGGAITSMLLGESPNDYDFYFIDSKVAAKVANYYLNPVKASTSNDKISDIYAEDRGNRVSIFVKSAGVVLDNTNLNQYDYFEGLSPAALDKYLDKSKMKTPEPYKPVVISTNAISLTKGVQLIMRFCGDPEEIHKNYDFVHCTNYYTEKTGLVLNQPALESILAKELKYVGSLYPLCSMFRLKKFIKRGWSVTAGEMLKIGYDIAKLNLDDPKVLQEQLVGVDQAFFGQLLDILRSDIEGGREIDRTYLAEVINRVFDEEDVPDYESTETILDTGDD